MPPQVLPFSFGEDAADVGDIASANCVVPKGDLPLEIRWSLNSAPVVNGENDFSLVRLNKRTSSLNIDSLNSFHRGVYKCIASNAAGSREYVAELQVNGLFALISFVYRTLENIYTINTQLGLSSTNRTCTRCLLLEHCALFEE